MKKHVLLIAAAIFSFGAMQAQEIRFGAKAGVNFASVGGDETDDVDGKTGFHIGGLVEIMITDEFGVQPELLYSAQGSKSEFTEDLGGGFFDIMGKYTQKTKLDYINIPIMAKYYVTEGLAIEAGPQIGFLVSANSESEVEISGADADIFEGDTDSGDVDISDFTSGVDFGVGVGASYRLDMGVFFGARYNLGLSNINDFAGSDDFKNQNNVIQLSVGYLF